MTKCCRKCYTTKPNDSFSRSNTRKDGLQDFCKICQSRLYGEWKSKNKAKVLKDMEKWRLDNEDVIKQYSKKYYRENKTYLSERKKEYLKTDRGKLYLKRARDRYEKKNPLKHKARYLFRLAVSRGDIMRPSVCSKCKTEMTSDVVEGHHEDYNKPFDVIWLCRKCHIKLHVKHKQAIEMMHSALEKINMAITTGTQDEIDLIGEIQVCRCCVSTLKGEA